MQLSVVVPTYNRKNALLSLLGTLNNQSYPIEEVIIVDSGTQRLTSEELNLFNNIAIRYLESPASVCIQRNTGIRTATTPWVFLCDDDLEVPPDYLSIVMNHAAVHPEAGAMSGLVLQKDTGGWMEQYPVTSGTVLWLRFIFQLSIWGEIQCKGFFSSPLKRYYKNKGNHLSKAGWPVITDLSGDFFKTPVYGLGASIVKREWLLNSPYEEILDPHGIGDNYGVACGFPREGIHVLKHAFVYHHQAPENRLQRPVLYYRRLLALHYFLKTKRELKYIGVHWFLWSIIGNALIYLFAGSLKMTSVNIRLFFQILFGNNPYLQGRKRGLKVIKPEL